MGKDFIEKNVNTLKDKDKRETLKKLGTLVYVAPATMLLVSADRAIAQSVCNFTIASAWSAVGRDRTITYAGPPATSVSSPTSSGPPNTSAPIPVTPGSTITVTADNATCWWLNGTRVPGQPPFTDSYTWTVQCGDVLLSDPDACAER